MTIKFKDKDLQRGYEHYLQAKENTPNWNPSGDLTSVGTGADNVLVGYISTTGYSDYRTYPCHHPITGFDRPKVLWSAFGYRTSEEVAAYYLHWLLHKSPWVRNNSWFNNECTEEFIFDNAFIFTNLDQIPGNYLHNFLIASRLAAEWPDFINAWFHSVTVENINPDLAFYFLDVFKVCSQDIKDSLCWLGPRGRYSRITYANKYDWPLDVGTSNEEYFHNFLRGTPVNPSKLSYFANQHTKPINTLWGQSNTIGIHRNDYLTKLLDTYKDYTERDLTTTQSQFGKAKQAEVQIFTPEAVIAIMKEEQKRLIKDGIIQ
jgi:hypothetical protein